MSKLSTSDSQQYTILIVDDTPTNLAIVVEYLEGQGFQVGIARDGKEAFKRAKFLEPDLILLDVMMPEMDGFETCRRLKAAEATRDIPVIFMTALEDITNKLTGFEVGGADYITKPFQIAELRARIEIHLSYRAMQIQLAQQDAQLQQEILLRQNAEAELKQISTQLKTEISQRTKVEQAFNQMQEELKRVNG